MLSYEVAQKPTGGSKPQPSGQPGAPSDRCHIFSFLSLPAELRNDIYRIHIRDSFIQSYRKRYPTIAIPPTSPVKFSAIEKRIPEDCLALLLTTRKIHDEASQVLFKEVEPLLFVYDYVPRSNARNCPEIFCDDVTGESIVDGPLPYYHSALCITHLDMKHWAKFRTLNLRIDLGPQFPCARDYNALRAVLSRHADALRLEQDRNNHPSKLSLKYCRFDSIADWESGMLTKFMRASKVDSAVETCCWVFSDIPGLEVKVSPLGHMDFGGVEFDEIPPGDAGRSFSYFFTNYNEGRRGFFDLGINDYYESDITDDYESDVAESLDTETLAPPVVEECAEGVSGQQTT